MENSDIISSFLLYTECFGDGASKMLKWYCSPGLTERNLQDLKTVGLQGMILSYPWWEDDLGFRYNYLLSGMGIVEVTQMEEMMYIDNNIIDR